MARPKNIVQLSDDDVMLIKGILKMKDASQTTANRCRILLALDENYPSAFSYGKCVDSYGVSRATVTAIIKNFSSGDIDAAPARKRSINSDQERRKDDRRTEARLIEEIRITLEVLKEVGK